MLSRGSRIPKGSIVTVNDNIMKVTYPDGTSKISNYDKAKKPTSELADINAGKESVATNNINQSLKLGETRVVNGVSITRVGRWMSPEELTLMQSTGKVIQGGGGQIFISINGVNDFKGAAPKGSVYVEFDVPSNSLIQGGKDGWYKMLGSDAKPSQKYQLNKQGGSLTLNVNNINILDKK